MTPHTAEIFKILRKGQFICANSPDLQIRDFYKILEDEDEFEALKLYFSQIDYQLETGKDYFYFSRAENRADLERKLEATFKWIDLVDFLKTYDSAFGVGFRFTPSEIANQLNTNADLKYKLNNLKKIGTDKKRYTERIRKIIEILTKDNYIALENELDETYKVLSSFHYLENLINTINISDDFADEIPQ